jgi:superfamily II DNA or RNA helicase
MSLVYKKQGSMVSSKTIPMTHKRLVDWAGNQVVRDAKVLVEQGLVLRAEYEHPYIKGSLLHNNREFTTRMRILRDGNVESECPCYANRERGIICAHVIAIGLTLVKRAADPERNAKHQEEARRAARLANIDDADYISRVPAGTAGACPAYLRVELDSGWMDGVAQGQIPISVYAVYSDLPCLLDDVPRDTPLTLSKQDESLLFVLEDISEGPAKGHLNLGVRDFMNLLKLMSGGILHDPDGSDILVHDTRVTTLLKMDMDRNDGRLLIEAHTELPFLPPGDEPFYVVAGKTGWAYGADHFWPLENLLPEPYHEIYSAPIVVERKDVLRFMQGEMSLLLKHARIESDISLDLFSVEPATPSFRLEVHGSPASLSATLHARYNGLEMVANKPDPKEHFAIPDPDDLMRYTARNWSAEKVALQVLGETGLRGEIGDALSSIVGDRNVLNFLGGQIPALRRRGWAVELHGRIGPQFDSMSFATPIVKVEEVGEGRWFDVGFDFEDTSGASISNADIQLALRKGDAFIERNGRKILIDSDAVESMLDVFSDCDSTEGNAPGHFRLSNLYAPFVKSSLDTLDGVDVDDTQAWRERAGQSNRTMRVEHVSLPGAFESILRPYQRDGVDWLRFLEANGFCGLLADEMGLGKTIQALAWLKLERENPDARNKPALIVCPTSLVHNWTAEAARFAPDLTVIPISGAQRHERWDEIPDADVIVTSYALLRRDIDRYDDFEFAAAVLDEAQHIKNRSTRNAVAAKQIQAYNKLVLTGTPVENSVSDLWSIMDFLMPGYLGRHDNFRSSYELPIARGGPDADIAQLKLRRKLRPFLLRRLKRDVAKELPPKIQSVQSCELSPDQQLVYKELLERSKRRIADMVASQGFNRCRMEILSTLLKLRQVCCHLDLLKLKDLKAGHPSAKMDLFFELVDEAIDGGHRILVFSQFVSMLHILRDRLDERHIEYCYLDGTTKDRMSEVQRFNTQRSIPIFLISLKAGGTGLNLTGADMVIHYDPWWNPAVEDQATDRAYRIGQKRTVYSVKLISEGTVEEKVLEMQKRKKAVINATVESDEEMVQSMTWDDVQELLDL